MSVFSSISDGIKNHFDKNRERREMMEQLQRDADNQRLITFKEEFGKNAKEVAIAQAKKDAAELSGLRKLRATNRARNLSHQVPQPGTFFEKMSDWTKKNKARMHENLARTAELRATAEKERREKLQGKITERESRMDRNKMFGSPRLRM